MRFQTSMYSVNTKTKTENHWKFGTFQTSMYSVNTNTYA